MRLIYRYLLIPLFIAAVLLFMLAASPALANPGLTVAGAMLVTDVSPGQTLTHNITLTIGSADPATDIAVQVGGMTQSLDGTNDILDVSQDTGGYSARTFITVDKETLHLEPGVPQEVTATIQVPADVGDGGRYAMINIQTQRSGGQVGVITAANVPIAITIKDSQLIHTGQITALSTGNITSGQPVDIFTDFQNTGNHHFKIKGEVAVSSASGQILGTIAVPLTAGSLVPGMTRQLQAAFIPPGELAPGNYNISSKIMLDDGTVLDESTGRFEVKQAYVPPPGTIAALSVTPAAPAASSTAPASSSASSTPSAGTASRSNWMYPVLAVAGVIIVVLLVLLLRRKR